MLQRLEIALKPELFDAEGASIKAKALRYFGLRIESVRTIHALTIDADLPDEQFELIRREIFTNPITQISSYRPLASDFDWALWVGFRPGVMDTAGATAVEAIEDALGRRFTSNEAVYTSKLFLLTAPDLKPDEAALLARELLANDIIQRWKVIARSEWDPETGIGLETPNVALNHTPEFREIPIGSDQDLARVSEERNLFLNPNDIPTIRAYFLDPRVLEERKAVGLSLPTDVEIEYISQAPQRPLRPQHLQGAVQIPRPERRPKTR